MQCTPRDSPRATLLVARAISIGLPTYPYIRRTRTTLQSTPYVLCNFPEAVRIVNIPSGIWIMITGLDTSIYSYWEQRLGLWCILSVHARMCIRHARTTSPMRPPSRAGAVLRTAGRLPSRAEARSQLVHLDDKGCPLAHLRTFHQPSQSPSTPFNPPLPFQPHARTRQHGLPRPHEACTAKDCP